MPEPSIIRNEFGGGVRDASLLEAGASQCVELSGLDHRSGKLRTMKGHARVAYNGDSLPLSWTGDTHFANIGHYTDNVGRRYLLGKMGRYVYVATGTQWSPSATWAYDMREIEGADVRPGGVYYGTAATNHGTTVNRLWSGPVRYFDGSSWLDTNIKPGAGAGTGHWLAWFKVNALPSASAVILSSLNGTTPDAGATLGINSAGTLFITVREHGGGTVTATANAAITVGTWYQVAIDAKATTPLIYLNDGADAIATTVTGTPGAYDWKNNAHCEDCSIGAYIDGTNAFNGEIGNVVFEGWSNLSAIYASLAPRYASTPTDEAIDWYPLIGTSWLSASVQYTRPRSIATSPECFTQINDYLYMTPDQPGPSDYPIRWDGFLCVASLLHTNGVTLTGNGTDFESMGIHAGDTIYLAPYSATTYVPDLGLVVMSVDSPTQITVEYLPATLDDGGTYDGGWSMVAVRVHRMGLAAGTSCAAADSGVGTLAAGTYKYGWREANTHTGYTGTMIASSAVTIGGNRKITISGWANPLVDKDANAIQIYRAVDSGAGYGSYKLIHTIAAADDYTALAPGANWTDDGSYTEGLALESDYHLHERPDVLRWTLHYNNQLYATSPDEPHILRYSKTDEYEYMPYPNVWMPAVGTLDVQGGSWRIGDGPHDPITAMVPEQGSYTSTGAVGSALLIFTSKACYRWTGTTRDDFQLLDGPKCGAINHRAAMNADGITVWVNGSHLNMMPSGSMSPTAIEGAIFTNALEYAVASPVLLNSWRVVSWNGWYMFLGSLTSTTPDTVWMYDPKSGTWTTDACAYSELLVVPDDPVHTLIGAPIAPVTISNQAYADIKGLYCDTVTPRPIAFNTGAIRIEKNLADILKYKHVKVITACFLAAPSSVSVTLELLKDGNKLTNGYTAAETVAAATTGEKTRVIVRWVVDGTATPHTLHPAIRLSANALYPFALEWLTIGGCVEGEYNGY